MVLALLAVGMPVKTSAADDGAVPPAASFDLTGRVQATGGEPLSSATVFIYTARPRAGTSVFCPSCYVDCAKRGKCDQNGEFKIAGLSSELIFRILVVAKGCKPRFVPNVDPAKGPVAVRLDALALGDAAPDHVLHGRVVDPSGQAIVGAVAEADTIWDQEGHGRGGELDDVDPIAVSDEKGEFVITSRAAFAHMDVRLSARGFANQTVTHLSSGAAGHKMSMTEGGALTGRVVVNGRPLPGVSVGVVGVDRSVEAYTGHFEIGTDASGRFTFFNLPPNTDYFLYGLMETVGEHGAIPMKTVHVGADGKTTDVKDLPVGHGYRVAGRVVLADGGKVPAHTRLLLNRQAAWDSVNIELDADGRFELRGVPAETVRLLVHVPGYRTSAKNRSFDQLNRSGLIGRIARDVSDLELLLEKGEMVAPNFSDFSQVRAEMKRAALPQNLPLGGAETPTGEPRK